MKLHLTRRYSFSASHRLHSEQLGEEENQRVYGKCNNPYGHGHNYVVEVAVSGPVNPATGMITNLSDHKYLNEEIAEFRQRVPTTENVCIEIFNRLRRFPNARLERVRVEETGLNSFEYLGEPTGATHE
jgi:6-pyruvoyltetrahydropterin/6-carboxytetrahydropterin synthase